MLACLLHMYCRINLMSAQQLWETPVGGSAGVKKTPTDSSFIVVMRTRV